MNNVFLSYTTKDKKKVDTVRAFFEHEDLVSCYMYERDSDPSIDSLPREIASRIGESDFCVFFWSVAASQRVAWVLREYNIAHDIQMDLTNRGRKTAFIFIFRLDDTPLPVEMSGLKYYEFTPESIERVYNVVKVNSSKHTHGPARPPFHTVDQYMTPSPVTVRETDTFEHALYLMEAHRFRHLIVVGESQEVVGFLSKRDILRALPPSIDLLGRENSVRLEEILKTLGSLPVERIMTTFIDLQFLSPQNTIDEALRLFIEAQILAGGVQRRISAVPILEQKKAVGILSYIDLLCALPLPDKKVWDYMIPRDNIYTVGIDDTLERCYSLMLQYHIRHLTVVDPQDRVLGVVDDNAILRILSSEYGTEVAYVPVEKFMIRVHNAHCLTGQEPLKAAARIFCQSKETGILLIADDGRLLGLLSYVNILEAAKFYINENNIQ